MTQSNVIYGTLKLRLGVVPDFGSGNATPSSKHFHLITNSILPLFINTNDLENPKSSFIGKRIKG